MTETGQGRVDNIQFVRVLGKSPVVGTGSTLYKYTIYVQKGTGISPARFAEHVEAILSDPRSWIRGGKVSFQRVAKGANTKCVLALPATVDKLCAPLQTEGKVSCNQGDKVVINADRWKEAVPHWTGSVKTYRQMVINHEFGHRIGQNHRSCPYPGRQAPVMQQQTYGLQGCVENSWPLNSEL